MVCINLTMQVINTCQLSFPTLVERYILNILSADSIRWIELDIYLDQWFSAWKSLGGVLKTLFPESHPHRFSFNLPEIFRSSAWFRHTAKVEDTTVTGALFLWLASPTDFGACWKTRTKSNADSAAPRSTQKCFHLQPQTAAAVKRAPWSSPEGALWAVSWATQSCPALCSPLNCSQAPLSRELSRQEHWRGLPFPPAGNCPNREIEPRPLALQAGSLPAQAPGKPQRQCWSQAPLVQWPGDRSHPASFCFSSQAPRGLAPSVGLRRGRRRLLKPPGEGGHLCPSAVVRKGPQGHADRPASSHRPVAVCEGWEWASARVSPSPQEAQPPPREQRVLRGGGGENRQRRGHQTAAVSRSGAARLQDSVTARGCSPTASSATLSVAQTRFHSSSHGQDFPGGGVDKNLPTSCRGDGFDPWCGKIPHAKKQLRLCAAAAEPACRSCWNPHA